MEAARNTSCDITIVGYHGNPFYRVVASIPIWVTCGRFLWKALTYVCKHACMRSLVAIAVLNGFYPHSAFRTCPNL
jgi:hypothetical protein